MKNEEPRGAASRHGYVRGCVFDRHHPLILLDRETIAMDNQQEQRTSPDRDEETNVRSCFLVFNTNLLCFIRQPSNALARLRPEQIRYLHMPAGPVIQILLSDIPLSSTQNTGYR